MSINPRFHNIFNFEFMTKLAIINNASWWGLSSGWRVSGHWSLYAISDALYHSSWVLNSSYETHQFSGSCPCLFPFQGSRIKVLQFSKKNLLVNLSMAKSNTTSVVKFVGELGRNSAFFLPAAQSPRESKLTQGITKKKYYTEDTNTLNINCQKWPTMLHQESKVTTKDIGFYTAPPGNLIPVNRG